MHNAAAIAGLGFGNSMAGLAHAMGHALGAALHVTHGRAVGLFLPYTIEFTANAGGERYADVAHFLRLPASDEAEGAASLVAAIRELAQNIRQPTCLCQEGITPEAFEAAMPLLIANAESDTSLVMSTRIPDSEELEKLYLYAYEGRAVDF
jgi:alcohol dehydrogenase class IV